MGAANTKEKQLIEELREIYLNKMKELQALERNVEPLDLVTLPQELIHKIVNKLEYTDFVHLERCSLVTENILNGRSFSLKHFVPGIYVNKKTVKVSNEWDYYSSELPRIPWHVATAHEARLKADIVNISHRASSGRIQAVTKLFERNGTAAEVLNINEHILFTAEDLDGLLTVLNISHLDCRQFLPREFFAHRCLQNLTSMTLYTTGCTDEELLHIKQDVLYMTNDFVTAQGLNKFLKQWKRGDRSMNVIDIEFDNSFNTRNFDIILEGLDANPVWTPDLHEYSMVRDIKLEEYYPMTTSDPEHVYSIFQKDDVMNFRMVRLSMGRFEVFSHENEVEFLLSYLDIDQYYLITGFCPLCNEQFCSHRKYLSTQRFKKFFPRLNDAIITGFKIASKIFAVGRYSQLLLGAPLPPVALTNDQVKRMRFEEGAHTSRWQKIHFDLRISLFNY